MSTDTDQLVSLFQQIRARENDRNFFVSVLIPRLTKVGHDKLQDPLIEAILESSPGTFTIPWVFALLNLTERLTCIDFHFAQLFTQFMESFKLDHVELISTKFVKLINEIDIRGEDTSHEVRILIASALRIGVIKLNEGPDGGNGDIALADVVANAVADAAAASHNTSTTTAVADITDAMDVTPAGADDEVADIARDKTLIENSSITEITDSTGDAADGIDLTNNGTAKDETVTNLSLAGLTETTNTPNTNISTNISTTTPPTLALKLTPLHTSLSYWSTLSNRFILSQEMLAKNITYIKPHPAFPISQFNVFKFHYYSSLILISQNRYFQAIEYLNIALLIPLIATRGFRKVHSKLRIKAYKKWLLISILQFGKVAPKTKLVRDDDCKLYFRFRNLSKPSSNFTHSLNSMNAFVKLNAKEFKADGNIDLVYSCIESYKQNYIKNLQKNVFSSMSIDSIASIQLTNDSVYDYINHLILNNKVSPSDYKLLDDDIPYIISSTTPDTTTSTIAQMNNNLTDLIQSIITCNENLDSVSQEIIFTGEYSKIVAKSLKSHKHHGPREIMEIADGIMLGDMLGSHPSVGRKKDTGGGSGIAGGIIESDLAKYPTNSGQSPYRRRSVGGAKRSNRRRLFGGALGFKTRHQRSQPDSTSEMSSNDDDNDLYDDRSMEDQISDNDDSPEN